MDEKPGILKMKKAVIYVNYSPYENAGHILDYLLDNFERVILFSIAFHTLSGRKQLNKITIYKNGKRVLEERLTYMKIPQNFVLFLIPIRSTINAIQIIAKAIRLRLKYGKIDIFFSVNAFTATIGIMLKKIGVVKENVYWVWDYYPIKHPNKLIRMLRWLYWQFDKFAAHADRVVCLNKRLANVRLRAGLIKKMEKPLIVPIGMGKGVPVSRKNLRDIKIGFLGVLKKSQGLDMLFDSSYELASNFGKLSFEIIGSGPDENYFKKRAKNLPIKFKFYGFTSEDKCRDILCKMAIGIAPYTKENYNVSRYGDPAKIKRYIEYNLPVIATKTFELSGELKKSGVGVDIEYGDSQGLINAINKIIRNYDRYVRDVLKLRGKYLYKDLYRNIFDSPKR